MRSWYLLMAAFLTILAILAFLLGIIEHPDRTPPGGLTASSAYRLAKEYSEASPCPWHLENITIRDSHDSDTVVNDVDQEVNASHLGCSRNLPGKDTRG